MDFNSIKLKEYAFMEWLRPELVIWDAIADKLIGDELVCSKNVMEIAIGNGFFTFMTLGGRFDKSFDFYYSVDLKKNNEDEDIYDCPPKVDLKDFIIKRPSKKLEIVIDNKQNLLDQRMRVLLIL